MDMTGVKRTALEHIRKMAGEARMKGLKTKYSPKTELEQSVYEPDTKKPSTEGEAQPLTDEELMELLKD